MIRLLLALLTFCAAVVTAFVTLVPRRKSRSVAIRDDRWLSPADTRGWRKYDRTHPALREFMWK